MASSSAFDLPEELVIEILTRLPVKSLMRFKCVCTFWCSLVESPSFISKHLDQHYNNNNSNNRIHDGDDGSGSGSIIVKGRRDNKDSFCLLSYETLDVISEDLECPFFKDDDPRRVDIEVLGCCNGIICLYNTWSNVIFLWNPATRQIKLVPDSPIPHPEHSLNSGLELGFGYDVETNDYKVIRLVTFTFPYHHWPGEIRAEVYNLSTDSWRLIDDAVVPGSFMGMADCRTCVNGIYSICVNVSDDYVQELVRRFLFSFDMSKQVSLLMPFPELLDADGNTCNNYKVLRALNQSLALIHALSAIKLNHFDVWVLNDYGPVGSWTKLYTIGPLFSEFLNPLGFWKNDELFFETSNGELVLCDPNTRELKSLQVDGENLQLFSYQETLVSIKEGNHLA